MGDRANIEVRDGKDSVYLYSHWTGSQMPEILRRALHRGEERWQQASYLTRIIFCEMVAGYEMELTGFGISVTEVWASKHLLVDVDSQTVTIDGYEPVSFKDYVAALRVGKPTEGAAS
jgi:hypothetical protein